jgi:hypothetical protein
MSAALNRYAIERDEYYGALRRILDWITELTLTSGPDADKGASGFFHECCRTREDLQIRSGLAVWSERQAGKAAGLRPRLKTCIE